METISSTSTADYDGEEVETSLTTFADAFHKIGNEYEHLCSIVLHMSKTQVADVIGRHPIIPFMVKNMPVKTETKMEPGIQTCSNHGNNGKHISSDKCFRSDALNRAAKKLRHWQHPKLHQ